MEETLVLVVVTVVDVDVTGQGWCFNSWDTPKMVPYS